jgi:hypothetical protein
VVGSGVNLDAVGFTLGAAVAKKDGSDGAPDERPDGAIEFH